MKILLVNKFFHINGGSELVFFKEREFLIKNGYDVIDFSMKDKRNLYSRYTKYFVPNKNFKKNKFFDNIKRSFSFIHSSVAVKNIQRIIINERPHIAHLHNIYHQLTPSIIPVLKRYGVKIILTLHDYKLFCPIYIALNHGKPCLVCHGEDFWKICIHNCHDSHSSNFLFFAEAIFHKWKKSYDAIDYFISPSKFLSSISKVRIPSEKMLILPNGIDTDEYQPHYSDDNYALYFGRLSKEKGVRTLLNAHYRMNKQYPLKIVGTGPLFEKLNSEFSNAEFVGHQKGKKLYSLIANSAYVIVPSEWYENFSMTVLEAMALGKPIIGSRIGGIPEQIKNGVNGFLFEMGNVDELAKKMEILSLNPELRNQMGRSSRSIIENKFSYKLHFSRLSQIYNKVLG